MLFIYGEYLRTGDITALLYLHARGGEWLFDQVESAQVAYIHMDSILRANTDRIIAVIIKGEEEFSVEEPIEGLYI